MNREILFRGKQVINGDWVCGYYVSIGSKYDYIFSGKLEIANRKSDFERFVVIPETVGRYTGLTDKNGTKIFEGDIISFFNGEDNTSYEVGWYKNQYIISDNYDRNDVLDDFVCENSVVIGNIYDNPELMEVSE